VGATDFEQQPGAERSCQGEYQACAAAVEEAAGHDPERAGE
jgi:hypothetical protein